MKATNPGKSTAVRKRRRFTQDDFQLFLLSLPTTIWYLLFCYKPMVGVVIAFQKYSLVKGMWGSRWVGLDNFEFVMGLRDFPLALKNTLYLNLLGLIVGFPVPIVLAIMLNEIQHKGVKRISQTLLYLPHFLSWIIIGGMVLKIFAPTTGVVNQTLLKWGLIDKNIPFLTDGPSWQWTYTLVGVWQNMGWGTILYLSAITGFQGNTGRTNVAEGIDGIGVNAGRTARGPDDVFTDNRQKAILFALRGGIESDKAQGFTVLIFQNSNDLTMIVDRHVITRNLTSQTFGH